MSRRPTYTRVPLRATPSPLFRLDEPLFSKPEFKTPGPTPVLVRLCAPKKYSDPGPLAGRTPYWVSRVVVGGAVFELAYIEGREEPVTMLVDTEPGCFVIPGDARAIAHVFLGIDLMARDGDPEAVALVAVIEWALAIRARACALCGGDGAIADRRCPACAPIAPFNPVAEQALREPGS